MRNPDLLTDEEINAKKDPAERAADWRYRAKIAEGQILAGSHRGRGGLGGAALFRKRPRGKYDPEIVDYVNTHHDTDEIHLHLVALYAGLAGACGASLVLRGTLWYSLPEQVMAEGWWHLCAQLGIVEVLARAVYFHPEHGQPSATKAAPPIERGPKVYCQGDW